MTLEELKNYDKETITPNIAGQVLHMNPHWIRLTARECPEQLGFPTIVYGSRVLIPRRAFIKFMEEGGSQPCLTPVS